MQKEKNKGYVFQDNVKKSCLKQDILFYRFKDSPFSFANSEKTKFTTNNVCDCLVFLGGKLLFLELKSVKGKSKSFSKNEFRQLNDIHKLIHNSKGIKRYGAYGGFLIEFRELEKTYFIDTDTIYEYFEKEDTKTINIDKLINKGYSYIEIGQKILVKNYTYDIRSLLINLKYNVEV